MEEGSAAGRQHAGHALSTSWPPTAISRVQASRAGFRALELSLRTIATPSQAIAQWSPVATWTPPPLRGQRRILTGFPILRSVVTKRHLRCDHLITAAIATSAWKRHRLHAARHARQTRWQTIVGLTVLFSGRIAAFANHLESDAD